MKRRRYNGNYVCVRDIFVSFTIISQMWQRWRQNEKSRKKITKNKKRKNCRHNNNFWFFVFIYFSHSFRLILRFFVFFSFIFSIVFSDFILSRLWFLILFSSYLRHRLISLCAFWMCFFSFSHSLAFYTWLDLFVDSFRRTPPVYLRRQKTFLFKLIPTSQTRKILFRWVRIFSSVCCDVNWNTDEWYYSANHSTQNTKMPADTLLKYRHARVSVIFILHKFHPNIFRF